MRIAKLMRVWRSLWEITSTRRSHHHFEGAKSSWNGRRLAFYKSAAQNSVTDSVKGVVKSWQS